MYRCHYAGAHARVAVVSPSKRQTFAFMRPLAIGLPCGIGAVHAADARPLPTGGAFVAGSESISGGQSVTINQTSTRGVIDWTSFSIGAGRKVTFDKSTGATLNRVTGSDASAILGQLGATGSVYLINPQGVLIGPSDVVATSGRFVASALNVDNAAFMAGGLLSFAVNGKGTAS